ncbi:MAG: serine/threonine protein kinase [Myxococcota bacterium]|jgi:serine/threonine protein kinase
MQIGQYTVISLLGHGAFGEVFRARLEGPMGFVKDVAIKRLHPHLVRGNDSVVQALIDEARLGGLLRHPNVVESHSFEQDEGTWFLTMEFVDGLTLQEVIARSREADQRVPPPARVGAAGTAL